MNGLLLLAAGYVLGSRRGPEAYDEVVDAARSVAESREFKALTQALKTQGQQALRELATRLAEEDPRLVMLERARARARRGSTEGPSRP